MFERLSLKLPITLGVAMIVILVALIVGWVLLAVFGAMRESQHAPAYWTVLSIGSTLFVMVLVGVVIYLVLTIKAINLNRRQSNFVDSVTHELKSPIASLKLCLQTLSRRSLDKSQRETFVDYMLDDVERLDGLITRLLAAGQISSRAKPGETERLRLDELVGEVVDSAVQRFALPDDAISASLVPCRLEANRIDLEMVVRNLVENAIKYGGSPLCVNIELAVVDGHAVLAVEDNGAGIPRSLRGKVFGRFVRLGSELERKQTGTGLGLYIVRTLIDRMGGAVSIDDALRGGASFKVRLPGGIRVAESDQSSTPGSGTEPLAKHPAPPR